MSYHLHDKLKNFFLKTKNFNNFKISNVLILVNLDKLHSVILLLCFYCEFFEVRVDELSSQLVENIYYSRLPKEVYIMKIETSITITETRSEKLRSAAERLGITTADMLAYLIKKSRLLFRDRAKLFRTVRYQPNFGDDTFVIMNIQLYPVDYEFAVSQRLVYRFSVSFVLRLAIDCFLDLAIEKGFVSSEENEKNAANYNQKTYDLTHEHHKNHEVWIVFWERRKKKQQTYKKTNKSTIT
jgi:hypothetical protein